MIRLFFDLSEKNTKITSKIRGKWSDVTDNSIEDA